MGSSVLFSKLNTPLLDGALRGFRIAPGELAKRQDDDDDGRKLPEIIFFAVNELPESEAWCFGTKKGSFLLAAARTQAAGSVGFLIRKNGTKSTQTETTSRTLLLLLQGKRCSTDFGKGPREWHPERKM